MSFAALSTLFVLHTFCWAVWSAAYCPYHPPQSSEPKSPSIATFIALANTDHTSQTPARYQQHVSLSRQISTSSQPTTSSQTSISSYISLSTQKSFSTQTSSSTYTTQPLPAVYGSHAPYQSPASYTSPPLYSSPATYPSQGAYPNPKVNTCGAWALAEGVCVPQYCMNDNTSTECGGPDCDCGTPSPATCKSGTIYGEQRSVGDDEEWHYSRSTHCGLSSGGACGFGLYSLCTKGSADDGWITPKIQAMCGAFCTAYPTLCSDSSASNRTLRGNFAAPNGNYYTQYWPSLPGVRDNYLSCGECLEVLRTKPDGTEYSPGETGYTDPIVLEIADSCPCDANPKWCCGGTADHCGEIEFKNSCPLPNDSIHLDLSDIAMGRLQGDGSLNDGVIPTRYKRVPCPKPGNAYAWLHDGAGPYWFAISVVNTAGAGSLIAVEIAASGSNKWVQLSRDPNYTPSRPQERYGSWLTPQPNGGEYSPPLDVRLTSPNGEVITAYQGIKSFTPPDTAPEGWYYIDLGVQFSM